MSYPLNYPTPQNANVQIFTAQIPAGDNRKNQNWVKPQGASFVWFTLIGGGSSGDAGAGTGGSSGAVTNFMCPAFLIPDELSILVGNGGANGSAGASGGGTGVYYQEKTGTGYVLLQANPGGGGAGGTASTSNYFTAMGFFQSVAGQAGSGGTVNPSATTFLSGGGAGPNDVNANYGYTNNGTSGWFQMSPIIVGVGGRGQSPNSIGGIGCGGGATGNSGGGPGLCIIITW